MVIVYDPMPCAIHFVRAALTRPRTPSSGGSSVQSVMVNDSSSSIAFCIGSESIERGTPVAGS
jgi:hypothetical protein